MTNIIPLQHSAAKRSATPQFMTNIKKYQALPWGGVKRVAEISGVKFRSEVYRALVKGEGPNIAVVEAAVDLVLLQYQLKTDQKIEELKVQKEALLSGADKNIDCFEKHSDLVQCQAEV